MDTKKTVSYHFDGCDGSEITNNLSLGSDVGYEFKNSPGLTVNGNKHFSERVMAHYYETLRVVDAYKDEIVEQLGDKKHQEIVELLQSIVSAQSKSPLEYMERFVSLGANTLAIWPAIKRLISMLAG
ncbi:hypothetical protein L8O24_07035 [Enterobacter kobei]|uniref:hypothetical protein n=1 Tax=Enterobacter kobei TaxID=208224 RepID=UPI000A734DA8|nr:hypothetical protein [Enterobacter kobei]MCK7361406.1 hypothetical protein [Enterobacter kobei]